MASPTPGLQAHSTVRVLVVEDRPFLVDRVAALSGEYSDIEVVGGATAGSAAMARAAGLGPHVVLVAERLSDADGLHVCDRIHRQFPDMALIFVSESQTDAVKLLAVEAGACGIISRMSPDQDLVFALLRAAEGEFLLPRQVTIRLFRRERELRLQWCRRRGDSDPRS
jgi:two-component system, NarL family, response regulator DevR